MLKIGLESPLKHAFALYIPKIGQSFTLPQSSHWYFCTHEHVWCKNALYRNGTHWSQLGTHDEALIWCSFTWPRLHDKHLHDVTIAWHMIAWQAFAWNTFAWQK